MPKPVKKATKKSATPKRPSSDPNRRAKQMLDEHMAKAATAQPPWAKGKDFGEARIEVEDGPLIVRPATPEEAARFEEMYRSKMAALGSKGGKISGAKRMEMPEKQRKAIAKKAAAARWGRPAK